MADYCATTRSNYFRVKDEAAFKQFCSDLNLEFWSKQASEPPETFYAITADTGDCSGWPSMMWDEEQEDHVPIDFEAELATHLHPTDVAILLEIGNEKLRYVNGHAIAIHPDGRNHTVSLRSIYDEAATLFGADMIITEAQY